MNIKITKDHNRNSVGRSSCGPSVRRQVGMRNRVPRGVAPGTPGFQARRIEPVRMGGTPPSGGESRKVEGGVSTWGRRGPQASSLPQSWMVNRSSRTLQKSIHENKTCKSTSGNATTWRQVGGAERTRERSCAAVRAAGRAARGGRRSGCKRRNRPEPLEARCCGGGPASRCSGGGAGRNPGAAARSEVPALQRDAGAHAALLPGAGVGTLAEGFLLCFTISSELLRGGETALLARAHLTGGPKIWSFELSRRPEMKKKKSSDPGSAAHGSDGNQGHKRGD